MKMPMSSLKAEDVAHLRAGDYVEAWFEELSLVTSRDAGEPLGITYKLTGVLQEYQAYTGSQRGLSLPGNGMAVRQIDGSPGTWLVSITKHVPAEELKS